MVGEFGTYVEATFEDDYEQIRERVQKEAIAAMSVLREHGLTPILHIERGDPVRIIAGLVEELAIDLVVIGHSRHKPFALRWWRGATDAVLVEKVRCSVLVAASSS